MSLTRGTVYDDQRCHYDHNDLYKFFHNTFLPTRLFVIDVCCTLFHLTLNILSMARDHSANRSPASNVSLPADLQLDFFWTVPSYETKSEYKEKAFRRMPAWSCLPVRSYPSLFSPFYPLSLLPSRMPVQPHHMFLCREHPNKQASVLPSWWPALLRFLQSSR